MAHVKVLRVATGFVVGLFAGSLADCALAHSPRTVYGCAEQRGEEVRIVHEAEACGRAEVRVRRDDDDADDSRGRDSDFKGDRDRESDKDDRERRDFDRCMDRQFKGAGWKVVEDDIVRTRDRDDRGRRDADSRTRRRIEFRLQLAACREHRKDVPIANAGPDQAGVRAGDTVLLDGSASSDPKGKALSYSWSLETIPPGSAAALVDPTTVNPNFVADRTGTYVVRLTVSNGHRKSIPDTLSVAVVAPPPTVTITAPANLSVVTATAVTVTGTVDDPGATLTVDGASVANNSGNYTASVTLVEGSNTVTVVGQNSTGTGSASVEVLVNTADNPVLTILSPKRNFISGGAFAMDAPFPLFTQIAVEGVIKVNTSVLFANAPQVAVNNVAASISHQLFNTECGTLDLFPPFKCWSFSATVPLGRGNANIIALGTDVANRSTTASVAGLVDYCRKGAYNSKIATPGYFDPGVTALAGLNHDIQSDRCHEIDGCSAPNVTQECADDPMQCPAGVAGTVLKIPGLIASVDAYAALAEIIALPATLNQAPTAFGRGAPPPNGIGNPPTEYFVHGDQSAYDLPCNHHDPCYQTCVPVAGLADADREQAWETAWHACNNEQHREMLDVCARAYPATCPYRVTLLGVDVGPDPIKCLKYFDEKLFCTLFADVYLKGVESQYDPGSLEETVLKGQPSGLTRFKQRQTDYCAQ
jgi:hypothetical protein